MRILMSNKGLDVFGHSWICKHKPGFHAGFTVNRLQDTLFRA